MSFLSWAKHVLFRPKHFFSVEEKKIKGWKHPIQYLIIFTLFATVFSTFQQFRNLDTLLLPVLQAIGVDPYPMDLQLSVTNFVLLYVVLSLTAIMGSFFRYFVTHWFVKMYNPKTNYQQTYKTLAFSTTPGWLGMPFVVLTSLLSFLAITRGELVFWLLFTISLLMTVIIESYSVYIRTVAIATTNKIHWFKAFLAIYIFGMSVYFLLLALAVALLTLIASLIIYLVML